MKITASVCVVLLLFLLLWVLAGAMIGWTWRGALSSLLKVNAKLSEPIPGT